ncbi:MAG: tRNA 4-thiouridine(8) synthase ThiI, partial [Chloroflexi bacterium]|nr:tRNA 4-thiouridine(8) synthase ThiI [Chloroflexota bacterium]
MRAIKDCPPLVHPASRERPAEVSGMVRLDQSHWASLAQAAALVTGDVLGQVASQTLENLAAMEGIARAPVLRPLVAADK